ncbi:hypothetical protein HAHE_27100 [Haloferula helveola]|uniref:Uncharacterized protein n=2 Tax=Haloferula helveola TaxID=490095 RepID=A0ABM7RH73_9BACT|nr:hypothetical protein HAHE_27100 [Haloferula helveola]
MVLISLMAVALLGLSSLTLRSSDRESDLAEARANARMALILAIGELQRQVGPDQRITAPASVLDDSPSTPEIDGVTHPHWTGVWDSWAAGRIKNGGDESSDHRTIQGSSNPRQNTNRGMNPSYEEGREDHFREWLVSLDPTETQSMELIRSLELPNSPFPDLDAEGVQLVGEGSLGNSEESEFVAAPLLTISDSENGSNKPRGRYAWWVADESTKARIMSDGWETESEPAMSELVSRTQSSGATGHEIIDALAEMTDEELLERVSSRNSLELAAANGADPLEIRRHFHDVTPWSVGLMTDVREGGLKQDLNALLERPISLNDPMHRTRQDDLLYSFDREGQERVPIQDLAAYYQCYRDVVRFSNRSSGNPLAPSALQVNNLDFGSKSSNPDLGTRFDFTREYTNLYRMPIPVKVQFMLSYIAEPRTAAEKRQQPQNRDTHKLHIGISPSLTFWNPYNVPLVMNAGTDRSTQLRFFNVPFGMTWKKGRWSSPKANDLVWITNRNQENGDRDNGFTLYVGGQRPIIFMPGEVRIFSLRDGQLASFDELRNSNVWKSNLEAHPGWDPRAYLELPRSERSNDKRYVQIENPGATGRRANGGALTFRAGDSISLELDSAGSRQMANGAALHFFIRQSNTMTGRHLDQGIDKAHMRRQYQMTSRLHKEGQTVDSANEFNKELMRGMFPGGREKLVLDVPVNSIIRGEPQAFMVVNLSAACEISEGNAGQFRGRRNIARPFLHSTPVQSTCFIDRADGDAAYQHGWNLWLEPVNSEDEVGAVSQNGRGSFYGGGYTADFGTSFCIQQEVPLTAPQSIAALSHATLSGYSLADRVLGKSASVRAGSNLGPYNDIPFANTTATGGNGLFPRTAQAVGNSYAHPHIPSDKAFTSWVRHFTVTDGARRVTFADHSYLANKALWDEYFFSSITSRDPRHVSNLISKRRDRVNSRVWDDLPSDSKTTARELAEKFLFDNERLPNPRFTPYRGDLQEDDLDDYFSRGIANLDGAEQLASHMMIEGPFNVNSTSVEAWKALFASMRETEVLVQPGVARSANTRLRNWPSSHDAVESEGTPVSGFAITTGEPWDGSTNDPGEPEQWHSWRSLTDEQIDELANAMVEQVKKRGPFLSLSEFVNRRLDSSDKELCLKGALQAALDDDDVSINEGFRSPDRSISASDASDLRQVRFREALEGPVAYGSMAYVDQADILRNLGGQLTPRGDSFVIRTYGDSVDSSGKILARAWCEAVVQRVPEYLDESERDEPHTGFDSLRSDTNRQFGRPLRLVSFRWLSGEEI